MTYSKNKGTAAETGLRDWLIANGYPALRNPPAGAKDVGDLTVAITVDDHDEICPDCHEWGSKDAPLVVEVKHYGAERMSTALANGTAELEVEKANAGTSHGVLVVRRPGKTDPGLWYAVRLVKDDPEIGAP